MVLSIAYVQRERSGSQVLLKETVELPPQEPHQSLVKINYAAQNPTDGTSLFLDLAHRHVA
jgi:NADPH:quinone reductase-like Zn-dependent oxidoreductase